MLWEHEPQAKSEKQETSGVSKLLIWRQIVLQLIIKRGQSNLTIVFILASGEEKVYFRVVSVGHLIFDCRMYCGLSRRMQGAFLMIFRRFPTSIRRFPKIFQNCSEDQTNIPEHLPKIPLDIRRFPKIAEDFRGRPEDVSMIHQRI